MLRDAKLLVFANKQDAPNACKVSDIANKLQLNDIKNRQWYAGRRGAGAVPSLSSLGSKAALFPDALLPLAS